MPRRSGFLFEAKRTFRLCAGILLLGLTAQTDFQEPFGLPTVAALEGPLLATWPGLQSEIKAEQVIIALCRAEPQHCASPAALEFIAIVNEGEQYEGLARIGHINRAANFALRATKNTLPDNWTSPLAALTRGSGDCKQYAVLKYAALTDAGFPPDDLRIIIVGEKLLRRQHAVVAVRNEGRWLYLDNRSLALIESKSAINRYIPLSILDHRGVRDFEQPTHRDQESVGAGISQSDRSVNGVTPGLRFVYSLVR